MEQRLNLLRLNGTGYLKGEFDYIRGFAGMFPKEDPQIIIYANVKRPKPNTANALTYVINNVIYKKDRFRAVFFLFNYILRFFFWMSHWQTLMQSSDVT